MWNDYISLFFYFYSKVCNQKSLFLVNKKSKYNTKWLSLSNLIPKKVKITALKIHLRHHAFVSFNWSKCCIFGLFLKKNLLTRTQAYEDELFKVWDIDSIPIISQVKYFLQVVKGDFAGANETRINFLKSSPLWMHQPTPKRFRRSFEDVKYSNIL